MKKTIENLTYPHTVKGDDVRISLAQERNGVQICKHVVGVLTYSSFQLTPVKSVHICRYTFLVLHGWVSTVILLYIIVIITRISNLTIAGVIKYKSDLVNKTAKSRLLKKYM